MDAARKAKLGERWVCFSCSVKFYDLKKPEPLCPKCGANQKESPLFKQKPKRARKSAKKAARPPVPVEEEIEVRDDADDSPDDDNDDELDLDDLEMSEDEDMSGVEIDSD